MRPIFILHFQPLELYPPVQNIIERIGHRYPNARVIVLTTRNAISGMDEFRPGSDRIKILAFGIVNAKISPIKRWVNYLRYYAGSILMLIWYRPDILAYFETLSSWPAYIYKKYFKRKAGILIHYHEYCSPSEYKHGMKLASYFHRKENWLFPKAEWVSHTNEDRMQKFKSDILPVKIAHPHIFPNYPPLSWKRQPPVISASPLRIVYIGALSLSTMFVKEFVEWVEMQKGKVEWDIYSFNATTDAEKFITSKKNPSIHLKGKLNYQDLPGILSQYHVGVILYRAHIPNWVYCAPNKLFEYLACGLDVWFPDVMLGSLPYVTHDTYPKVLAIDFDHLDQFSLTEALDRSALQMKVSNYFSETVADKLVDALFNQPELPGKL